MIHLLSDFVVDLYEMLEIPYDQHVDPEGDGDEPRQIEDIINARLKIVRSVGKAEDLMVHLTTIASRIINKRIDDEDEAEEKYLEPTDEEISL